MPIHHFPLDPSTLGLPTRDELVEMRMWDCHYHGVDRMEEVMPYFDRMGVEALMTTEDPEFGTSYGMRDSVPDPRRVANTWKIFEQYKGRFCRFIRINLGDPEFALQRMDRWIRNGPSVGIKIGHGIPGGVRVDHPNADPIMEVIRELKAVVVVHAWIQVGGQPRRFDGGNDNDDATPMEVARLAARYPDVPIVCGHSGGDWELGVRAVRAHPNVLFEFAGGDSWSGVGDMALKELGADRLVWGSHAPSRSFATELTKVYSSSMTRADRMKCLGRNLRRVLEPIFREKGYPITV